MNVFIQHNKYLIIIPFIFFVVSGCEEKSEDATQAFKFNPVADQFKKNAINIGSIANVPSIRDSVLLAVKQINEAGGVLNKELNVIALVAADTEEAIRQAQNILEKDIKVLNVSYSSRSKAVSALTIAKQIPLISESATSPFFSSYEDKDLYFRMVPSDIIQSRILAELAIAQGYKTAVTVHNETDQYGITLAEYFLDDFTKLGGQVLENIPVPFSVDSGFDPYLQRIIDHSPDVILGIILEADESANFVNESIAYGIQAKFMLPDSSAGQTAFSNNIADVGSIVETLGTASGFGLVTNPEMIHFNLSYQQQFGREPESFNVSGYDFAMVTAMAIEHAGLVNNTNDPTGLMVRDSLRAVMNPPGQAIGPSNITEALQLIRSGQDVDYTGGYGANDWDANGDITGEITYDVMGIDVETKSWKTLFQQQVFIP
ncbi:MAG: branched-chain amino acid transport system substrate-binding protein [Cognaticolwellia sp.]|jgi:branched-chain amino acid transport system substrate-binding protein